MTWDDKGWIRKALVPDSAPDELAQERGMAIGPPDLTLIDWELVRRDLHNELMNRGLHSWRDVQASQNGVSAAIRLVFNRRVIQLYKTEEKL